MVPGLLDFKASGFGSMVFTLQPRTLPGLPDFKASGFGSVVLPCSPGRYRGYRTLKPPALAAWCYLAAPDVTGVIGL